MTNKQMLALLKELYEMTEENENDSFASLEDRMKEIHEIIEDVAIDLSMEVAKA